MNDERIDIELPQHLIEGIDKSMIALELTNRSEAIRSLVTIGLQSVADFEAEEDMNIVVKDITISTEYIVTDSSKE